MADKFILGYSNKLKTLVDPRAEDSNYMPFDVKVGKATDFPDTPEGRKKMFETLRSIRKEKNPAGKGYGIGDI